MLLNLWTKEPTTILFVTHNLKEAIYLSDRIVFLTKPPTKVLMEKNVLIKRPRNISAQSVDKMKKKILSENKQILKG